MNKNKYVILLIVIVLIAIWLLFVIFNFKKQTTLSNKIISYYEKINEDNFIMNLNDFTDFDWDYVIIYRNPATAKDISEISGVSYEKYEKELDLSSGMIFIANNKIVYKETFKTDFESPYKFVIYPYQDINSDSKINKIQKENASFKGKKKQYNNENRYSFYPIN